MRLVVVSNRVHLPGSPRAGGMAVGIDAALAGREGIWIGWSGGHAARPATHRVPGRGLDFLTVDLPEATFRGYYTGFSNQTLWPALHGRGDLVRFSRADLADYLAVNRALADVVAGVVGEGDLVWVHDYHLFPLAEALRQRGVRQPVGFFLHTPFGTPPALASLPVAGALARWLEAYDVAGFQTEADAAAARAFVGARASRLRCGQRDRFFSVPIGIDARAFAATAEGATVADPCLRDALSALPRGAPFAIAVDRIDYSKGIPERIAAFARYRALAPASAAGLLQVAVPSRMEVPAYRAEERRMMDALAAAHAAIGPSAVSLVRKAVDRTSLAAADRRAAVGLVTPIRDGMNLVAQEYVAAQDPGRPGALVLSSTAGAACGIGEGALVVNPADRDGVARAIRAAFAMPLLERQVRWRRMMARLEAFDAARWARDFLTRLARVRPEPTSAPRTGGREAGTAPGTGPVGEEAGRRALADA